MRIIPRRTVILAISFIVFLCLSQKSIHAQSLDDLKNQIEARNVEIAKLEKEAEEYRKEVASKQTEAKTLKNELSRIDSAIRRLRSDTAITEQKIKRAGLEIDEIILEMRQREFEIKRLKSGLASLVQIFFEKGQEPLIFAFLRNSFLSDFFSEVDYLSRVQQGMLVSLDTLHKLRRELDNKKIAEEAKKAELADLRQALLGQNKVQQGLRGERSTLLSQTQNQEKKYAQLLADREKQREALEGEIRELEEKIRVTFDPASLPAKGSGVLGNPLEGMRLASCATLNRTVEKYCITQYFGYTSFAAGGAYSGKGHNGMDFRAETGTPVLASANGIVMATGDTDAGCRRASYGKWVLIRHDNNLATIYAHLSSIGVVQDQEIKRGERIGFSGSTGYATGPHLHFGVFVAQAVQIETIKSKTCGRNMTIPIAPINGYLNPADYL